MFKKAVTKQFTVYDISNHADEWQLHVKVAPVVWGLSRSPISATLVFIQSGYQARSQVIWLRKKRHLYLRGYKKVKMLLSMKVSWRYCH